MATTPGSGGLEFDPAAAGSTGGSTTRGSAQGTQTPGATAGGGYSGPPKLVIFGGNGFVGSRVTEEAVKSGVSVVSISRRGQPPPGVSAPWTSQVEWAKGDVFDPASWKSQLDGAIGVISTLGGFGSNEHMYKICGQSNIQIMEAAKEAGVDRFAFVSAHNMGLPDWVLKGYVQGKRDAEARLAQLFPNSGVALRPGFIHGTRNVAGIPVPLQIVGLPLEKLLSVVPTQSLASVPLVNLLATPPVSASAVGRAAVAAATDPAVPAGVMDVFTIGKNYSK
jgi:uncharacterized protein YbjT (DUF2867 family)